MQPLDALLERRHLLQLTCLTLASHTAHPNAVITQQRAQSIRLVTVVLPPPMEARAHVAYVELLVVVGGGLRKGKSSERLAMMPIVQPSRKEEPTVAARPRGRGGGRIELPLLLAPRLGMTPSNPRELGHGNAAGVPIVRVGEER